MSCGPERELAAVGASQAQSMDRMYRLQRHVYDLSRKYYLLGRDRLIADLEPPPGATVLELACGTGRNLVAVARRYPGTRVFGVDISGQMLKSAEKAVRRAGLTGRIGLAQGDATSFDAAAAFDVRAFDRVFISYALSMIPPWRDVIGRGLALTAPGGRLAVVDFGLCEGLPGWFEAGLHAWLRRFGVTPRADLAAEAGDQAVRIGARPTTLPLARGYAAYVRIERLPSQTS